MTYSLSMCQDLTMTFLNNLFGGGTTGTAVAPAPVVETAAAQQTVVASPAPQPAAPVAQTTPQQLAQPAPENTLGAQVVKFLAPAANKALEAAHLDGQDLTGATSIASFIGKPILDQLKGEGKGWEGSKQQTYIRAVVNKLSAITKELKNDSSTALDAAKSIAYIAGSLESPQAVQIAFESLLELADPASRDLAHTNEGVARQAELKTAIEPLLADLIQAKPAEAIKTVLQRSKAPYHEQSPARLQNTVKQALLSPNNKEGIAETAIMTNLGSFDATEYGNDTTGALKHQVKVLGAIQKGLSESEVSDQKLTAHLAKLSTNLSTKIEERKNAA